MNAPANLPRILLIDTNVYFAKRLGDALREQGFEVVPCTQATYALTMLEWDAPAAIVCATNLREMGAYEMAPILRADPKTASIPLIAVGGEGDQALLEAYRAGCDDYVDRRRPPADIASHVRSFLVSRQDGFQPTQMLSTAETALSGSLLHLDLPGVMQMLGQAHQTGALHINAADTDGIIFFEGGEIFHAECGTFFGDEAVTQIVKTCQGATSGVYKFVYGATAAQRTVLRSATDLLLDAMREFDEEERDAEGDDGEGVVMSEIETLTAARTPTVYFIDDSATMREVIKIAFRKENIHVVTCPDAASAMAQFGDLAPDAVITDVIMPDKDGYEVCQFIKQHDQLGRTPVILMSGVVNRTVAEKAMAVKADELIRKPFQPQDLIARVKNLLNPKRAGAIADSTIMSDSGEISRASSQVLTGLFSPNSAPMAPASPAISRASSIPVAVESIRPIAPMPAAPAPATRAPAPNSAEVQKLRNEIRRFELLVKKLQAELEAEHQYCAALEAHFKTLQESE